jgi:hypothetical protein
MRTLAVVTVLAATAIGGDAASACGLGLWGTGAGVGVSKYRAGTYGYGAGVGYGVGVRRGWGYRGVDVGRPGIGVGRPVARAAAFGAVRRR